MRKSLFCLFLFVTTLPAFSDDKFALDTQIAWNGEVVADAIRAVGLDQNTANSILVDLLARDKFSVSDAVRVCRSYCDQLSQTSQDFCPTVCGNFATNLVTINNERARKSAKNCPNGTYDIGFPLCVSVDIEGTSSTYSAPDMTWKTVFPYGSVSGVAVCSDTTGSPYVSSPDVMQETGGIYCWCKMTHRAVSLWVLNGASVSSSSCAQYCAQNCGDWVQRNPVFRSSVFSSVGK